VKGEIVLTREPRPRPATTNGTQVEWAGMGKERSDERR